MGDGKQHFLGFVVLGWIFSTLISDGRLQADPFENLVARLHSVKNFRDFALVLKEQPWMQQSLRALVPFSLSSQHGSMDAPRMIVFHPQMKVMLAFTGSLNVRGGDTVEILGWNSEKVGFTSARLRLGENVQANERLQLEPKACKSCHGGAHLRPNWQNYNRWFGVFGAQHHEGSVTDVTNPYETAFVSSASSRGRYRFFNWFFPGINKAGNVSKYLAKQNCDISLRLSRLNWVRVVATLDRQLGRQALQALAAIPADDVFDRYERSPNLFTRAFRQMAFYRNQIYFPAGPPEEKWRPAGVNIQTSLNLEPPIPVAAHWSTNYSFGDQIDYEENLKRLQRVQKCSERKDFKSPVVVPSYENLTGTPFNYAEDFQSAIEVYLSGMEGLDEFITGYECTN